MSRPIDEECVSVCLLNVLNSDKFEVRKDFAFKICLKKSKCSNEIC